MNGGNNNNEITGTDMMMDHDDQVPVTTTTTTNEMMTNNTTGSVEGVVAVDETPEFVNLNDVEEVVVDDDNIPMESDDDDDDNNNNADDDEQTMGGDDDDDDDMMDNTESVIDMSRIKISTHTGPVYAVASFYDPIQNEYVIVSGGGDDKAYYHRVKAVSPPSQLPDTSTTTIDSITNNNNTSNTISKLLQYTHTDSVSSVAVNTMFLPSHGERDPTKFPHLMAIGSYDGMISLYDADTGTFLHKLEGPTDVEWIKFHPNGGTVLLVGSSTDGTIWMYHLLPTLQYKCLQVFVGHEQAVTDGNFTPDGKLALSCSSDGTIRIWAPRTGLCKHVFRFPGTSNAGLTCLAMKGGIDSQLIIVGTEDGYAHVCHIGTKKVVATLQHYEIPQSQQQQQNEDDDELLLNLPMSVEAVSFASIEVNPNWCATGGIDGIVKIWDLTIGKGQCRQICQPPAALPLPPTTTTQLPVVMEEQNNTTATTTSNQQEQQSPSRRVNGGGITRLQWHPSLPYVFASTTFGTIYLYDARNGQLLQTLTGGTDVVNDMNIHYNSSTSDSTTNTLIISGSDDHSVRIHQLDIC